jgi:ATP-dependent Lhr-like helicase
LTARRIDVSAVEQAARQFLRRYGVVFRDLLARESLSPPWRDLLVQYRRLEFQGEIRGGRFVDGFVGEQFALPEAVESLRAMRRERTDRAVTHEIRLSAADPLNLAGVILPGPRVPSSPSNYVLFRNGVPIRTGEAQSDVVNIQVS